MVDYITSLPLELQNKILNEIPQFTRLSKNVVAGKYHLNSLSFKEITREELKKYVRTIRPDKWFEYYFEDDKFIIKEYYFKFGVYELVIHNVHNYQNLIIISIDNNKVLLSFDINNSCNYDLFTVYNIYKHFRKESTNINKILVEHFNKTYYKNEMGVIQLMYLYSNKLSINDDKRLSVLTIPLKNNSSNFLLNIREHYSDKFELFLSEIYEYIENIK